MKQILFILFLFTNVLAYSQVVSLPSGGQYRSQFIDSVVTSPGKPYPVLSGMDVVNTGWTSVGSGTFSKVITHNISGNPVTFNYHMIQVAEVDTAYEKTHPVTAFKYLFQAFTLASCQATPGSYYNADLVVGSTTATVYLHPTTGTPGSNKYRYEVTTRNYVIAGSTNDAFIASVNNTRYENLWLRSNGNGYGMIAAGDNTHIKNVLFQGGGTHDAVIHSGTIDNSLFLSGSNAQGIALTFYEENAGGNIDSLTNSRFFNVAAPFGMHNGGDTFTRARKLYISNFKAFNNTTAGGLTAVINSGVDTASLIGAYIENYQAGYIPSATVENAKSLIIKDVWQSGVQYYPSGTGHINLSNSVIKGKGSPTNQSNVAGGILTMYRSQNSFAQQDVTNNIFWPKTTWHPSGTAGQPGIAAVMYDVLASNHAGQTGFINALHNIYIADNPAGDTVLVHNSGNFYADSNVYVILKGAGFVWRDIQYGPGVPGYINRTDTLNYEFGRYDVGYARARDVHSIVIDLRNDPRGLKAIFVDPDNGDFRLAKTAEADRVSLLRAGLTTPILQYPVREDVDFLTYAPVVYSPSRETGIQKPLGTLGFPVDGHTQFHDTTNGTYRDYIDTTEVFNTLNTPKKRQGGEKIFINFGGTLLDGVITGGNKRSFWFRNGTENSNLEEIKTDGPNADEFKETTDALTRNIGSVAAKILPFPSSLAYTNAANTFTPLQTLSKGLKLYQDINGRFLTIGAPQVGDILYGDFPVGNYYAMKFSQTAQCNTCYVEWSGNPTGNLATPRGLVIHSNGGIGLNVAVPTALLDVDGTTKFTNAVYRNAHAISGLDIVYKQHLDTLLAGIVSGGLPSQAGQNGKYLTTNGSTTSWTTISGGSGGDVYQAGNNTFTGTNTFSGLTFSGSPTLSASTFITITSGIYVPGGNIYANYPINARGGMQDDIGAVLQIYGGTSKRTNFNGGTASFDTPHFLSGLDIVYKQHLDSLLVGIIPSQTSNAGKFLTTNGSALSWVTLTGGAGSGSGTVTSVSATVPSGFSASISNATTTPNIAITASFAANQILMGNGTGITSVSSGANGTYLKMVAGVPTWVSDSALIPTDGTINYINGVIGISSTGAGTALNKSITITTAAYTVASGIHVVICDNPSGTTTITLPTTFPVDYRVTVKNFQASNNVTSTPVRSGDGNLLTGNGGVTWQWSGSVWFGVSKY